MKYFSFGRVLLGLMRFYAGVDQMTQNHPKSLKHDNDILTALLLELETRSAKIDAHVGPFSISTGSVM